MKKIINKSKLFFYAVLVFIFSVNIVKANEIEQWGTTMSPSTVPTSNIHIYDMLITIIAQILALIFIIGIIVKFLFSSHLSISINQKIKKIIILSFTVITGIALFNASLMELSSGILIIWSIFLLLSVLSFSLCIFYLFKCHKNITSDMRKKLMKKFYVLLLITYFLLFLWILPQTISYCV